jgi:hypothetical protein
MTFQNFKLLDTKSQDKKQTLLHYLAETASEKFPEIVNIDSELTFIDKAAMVSLENVQFDMNELEKGMRTTKKEYEIRLESKASGDLQILKEFLSKAEQQFNELSMKYKTCTEQFNQCVEYFGEAPRSQSPSGFFTIFVKFIKAFNQVRIENEQRKLQEAQAAAAAAAAQALANSNTSNDSPKMHGSTARNGTACLNNEMIKELKQKGRGMINGGGPRIRSGPQKKEINIEDLIEEINRGYVTADAERRKRQRTQEIKKDGLKTSSPIQII